MSEWRSFVMRDVMAEFHDGPHATPPPAESGPVFLGIKNISDSGILDLSQIRHIAEHDFARWTRRVTPRPGDVVFAYEATLHRYALIPEGFRGCLGRRLALIRPDRAVVLPRFLHFVMLGPRWRRTVTERVIAGSTVDRIPLIEFPRFPIELPDLATQAAVLDVLGGIDDLIENNRRRIALLEQMAQAIYREWFVHFRYPGHEEDELVESPLGPIPYGWRTMSLGTVADTQYGFTDSATQSPDGPKFLRVMDINKRSYITWSDVPHCSPEAPERFRLRHGDVVIARMADPGKVGIIEHEVRAVFASYLVRVRPTADWLHPYYLYFSVSSGSYRDFIVGASTGATRKSISAKVMEEGLIARPPDGTVEGFVTSITPLREHLTSLARSNEKLNRTRDLLLPKLVTGAIDVSHLDLDALVDETAA